MAMARPASDMMLESTPARYMRMKQIATLSGNVTSTEIVLRRCSRKMTMTRLPRMRFFEERFLERVDGLVDDVGAVVERHDVDLRDAAVGERLLRQAGFELLDLLLHPLDDVQRVFAVAHQHHAAHGFHARLVERAAAEVGAERDGRDVLHLDRRALSPAGSRPSPSPRPT